MSTQHWLDYYAATLYRLQPVTVDLPMSADTYIQGNTATTNYDTSTSLIVGASSPAVYRAWIKPDFSAVPVGATFITAILKLTPITDVSSNARTMTANRCLRDVVSDQATWNIWKTSNNWGTAGAGNSSTDYDGAVALGTMTQPASPTLNVALEMTLTASELQKLFDGTYTNNGITLRVDTESLDAIVYASTNHATSEYRPIITLTYMP
jgi:hypothetical protein